MPHKTEPLLIQEALGEDTDVWIIDLEGIWMCVLDFEYTFAPILYAPASRPLHRPTTEEEAIAQEYTCRIEEEDLDNEDNAETP